MPFRFFHLPSKYSLFNARKVDFLSGKRSAVPEQAVNAVIKFTCAEGVLYINTKIKKAAVPLARTTYCYSTTVTRHN